MLDLVNAGVARLPVPFIQARIPLTGAPLITQGPAVGTGTGAVLPGHRPAPVSLAAVSRGVAVHRVTECPVIVCPVTV